MKSLATVAVIATLFRWTAAFAADSQTQVIECNDGEPLITVTMQNRLLNHKDIQDIEATH